ANDAYSSQVASIITVGVPGEVNSNCADCPPGILISWPGAIGSMMPVCGCSSHHRPPSVGDVGSTEALAPQVVWMVSPSLGSFLDGVAEVNVPKFAVDPMRRILTGGAVAPARRLAE